MFRKAGSFPERCPLGACTRARTPTQVVGAWAEGATPRGRSGQTATEKERSTRERHSRITPRHRRPVECRYCSVRWTAAGNWAEQYDDDALVCNYGTAAVCGSVNTRVVNVDQRCFSVAPL